MSTFQVFKMANYSKKTLCEGGNCFKVEVEEDPADLLGLSAAAKARSDVVEIEISLACGKMASASAAAEMRQATAIHAFIANTDPYRAVMTSPNPVRAGAVLDEMALNPMAYCQKMSGRHHMCMLKMAEYCLHRKL